MAATPVLQRGFTRVALIGLFLVLFIFTGHAKATDKPHPRFKFTPCVSKCISESSQCDANRARCMCKRANRGQLLTPTLDCLAKSCPDDLRDADDGFLDIIDDGCKSVGRPIKEDAIDRAEEYASSLWESMTKEPTPNQPPKTTAAPTKTSPPSGPAKETTTAKDDDDDVNDDDTPSITSSSSSATTDQAAPNPNTAAAPGPAPEPTNSPQAAAPNQTPVDYTPFGDPTRSGGAQNAGVFAATIWALVPLAAALLSTYF